MAFHLPATSEVGFRVHLHYTQGSSSRPPGTRDQLRVIATSQRLVTSSVMSPYPAIRASPRITHDPNCSVTESQPCYTFTLALPPAAEEEVVSQYTMSIYLEQGGYSSSTLRSEFCSPVLAAESRILSIPLLITATPGALRRRCEPNDAITAAGWYVAASPPPRIVKNPFHPPVPEGRVGQAGARWIWQPAGCDLKPLTAAAVRSVLRGRWLAFSGDSTLEELAAALVIASV